jgi:hypothetical protein
VSTDQDTSGRPASAGHPDVPEGRTPADLDRFWTGYEPNLHRYAGHLLDQYQIPADRADADDVTSDVYVELRENWPTVRFPIAYARARARAAVFAALRDEERRGHPRSEGANDDEDDGFDIAQPGLGIEDELVEQETASSGKVAGLHPGGLVPHDLHRPQEPKPTQQRQRVRPLRSLRPADRLQILQKLGHREVPGVPCTPSGHEQGP